MHFHVQETQTPNKSDAFLFSGTSNGHCKQMPHEHIQTCNSYKGSTVIRGRVYLFLNTIKNELVIKHVLEREKKKMLFWSVCRLLLHMSSLSNDSEHLS